MTFSQELLIAEYNSLRAEILAQQARRDLLVQIYIGAIALMIGWLATHRWELLIAPEPMARVVWMTPAAIGLFGLLQHLAISAGVRRAAAHLALIQYDAFGSGPGGWEKRMILEKPENMNAKGSAMRRILETAIEKRRLNKPMNRDVVTKIWTAILATTLLFGLVEISDWVSKQ